MKKWVIFLIVAVFTLSGHAQKSVRKVGIGFQVMDVTEIDPKKELILIIAKITFRWQTDKTYSENQFFYGSQVDKYLSGNWYPYFTILNSQGKITPLTKILTIKKDGVAEYIGKYKMTIKTPLNLYRFPFDHQNIHITIEPFKNISEKIEYYLLKARSGISEQAHHDEWHFLSREIQASNEAGAKLKFKIHYRRQAGYYIYKVFLPLLVIISISYLVLWLPLQPAINRLAFIITALLTIIAFQWAVISDIPRVSYITYFQAMLLFSFIYIGAEAIFIVVGEGLSEKSKIKMFRFLRMIYPLILVIGIIIISLCWFS